MNATRETAAYKAEVALWAAVTPRPMRAKPRIKPPTSRAVKAQRVATQVATFGLRSVGELRFERACYDVLAAQKAYFGFTGIRAMIWYRVYQDQEPRASATYKLWTMYTTTRESARPSRAEVLEIVERIKAGAGLSGPRNPLP